MRPVSPIARFFALLPALAAAACSGGESEGPPMVVEEVTLSLVSAEDVVRAVRENPDAPLERGTFAPQDNASGDSGPLPAIALAPPGEARIEFRPATSGRRLDVAVGFDASAHAGEDAGRVRFTLTGGVEPPLDVVLPYGPKVPRNLRVWKRVALELTGGEIVLATELVSGSGVPRACFAALEIVETHERPRERATERRPNVVLVVVDTLRYDRLGCYGHEDARTPVVDELARRGTLYEDAYAAAPWTWPSTASILTGLSPAEHGVRSHAACYLADALTTLPEALQREGWSTAGFSANPLISASKAFDQGFERFESYQWKPAETVVDDALAWLDDLGEWRFFLYLQLTDPHDYAPSDAAREALVGPPPEGFTPSAARRLLGKKLDGKPYDEERFRRYVAHLSELYDACVADVDTQIGRIVERLAAEGRLDETLIVVTSDHGEEFLDRGLLYHGWHLHRELVGVPLVIAGPGIPSGRRVPERVENRFLPATLLARLDVANEDLTAGVDLLDRPSVAAGALEAVFTTTEHGIWHRAGEPDWRNLSMHGVLLGDWLYVWVPELPDESAGERLFDLASDPEGHVDVSAGHPERCADLRDLIGRWQERGESVRPNVLGGGEDALRMLRNLGYVEGGDEH